MPSENPSGLYQVAHASDMPGSIQAAVRVIEAKDKLIDFLHGDLARHRAEIARLKIIVTDLKAYIARKARAHG